MAQESHLIRFHASEAPDRLGRRFDAILAFSDDAIEHVHDFIHWLFPSEIPGRFNRKAPSLTAAE